LSGSFFSVRDWRVRGLKRKDNSLEFALNAGADVKKAKTQTRRSNGFVFAIYHFSLTDSDKLSVKIELPPRGHIQFYLGKAHTCLQTFRYGAIQ